MNSPNIIVLNARVLFLFGFFPLFLCFSFFFFYTVVSLLNFCFCVKRDLAFRVTFVYHVRSEILLERHKNIVLGPGQSLEKGQWKLGTFASFLGQPILSINLTLPDESLYACSFFFSRAGKLADRLSVMPHPDSSFVIQPRRCCQSVPSSQSHYWGNKQKPSNTTQEFKKRRGTLPGLSWFSLNL